MMMTMMTKKTEDEEDEEDKEDEEERGGEGKALIKNKKTDQSWLVGHTGNGLNS